MNQMKILKICDVHLDFRNGTHDWEPMYIVNSTII